MHDGTEVLGHAGDDVRTAFEWIVETGSNDLGLSNDDVLVSLATCGDIMPSHLCGELDVPQGSNYAEGVEAYRAT